MEFTEKTVNGVTFGQGADMGPGVVHGFSTRLGGVSRGIYASLNLGVNRGDDRQAVEENYRRFCAAIGADVDKVVFSSQVHGDAVRVCTAADAGSGLERKPDYEADGLITDVPGLCLVVFSADCLPILLHDPVRRVAAAGHAGWRGTANGIVERACEKMRDLYGCRSEDIRAAIGPCIGPCCFETHQDVPDAMCAALGGDALAAIAPADGGKFHVDLKKLNAMWLRRAGVGHIDISGACTACEPDRFWSHRRVGGRRGSLAAVITCPDP